MVRMPYHSLFFQEYWWKKRLTIYKNLWNFNSVAHHSYLASPNLKFAIRMLCLENVSICKMTFLQAQVQGQIPFVAGVSEQNVRKIHDLYRKGKKPAQILSHPSIDDENLSEDDVNRVVACLDQANRPNTGPTQGWLNNQVVILSWWVSLSCFGNVNLREIIDTIIIYNCQT